jgi:hypothetical protein
MSGVPEDFVHLDVEFALNPERDDTIVFDCATGFHEPRERAVRQAAELWFKTTAPALLTFMAQGRTMLGAQHFHAGDPGGVPGWHCIVGPDVVYGSGDDSQALFDHLGAVAPLSRVAPALATDGLRPFLNGVKLFRASSGAESAEVRVNGRRDERASQELAALPWPAAQQFSIFRKFALLLAPE